VDLRRTRPVITRLRSKSRATEPLLAATINPLLQQNRPRSDAVD